MQGIRSFDRKRIIIFIVIPLIVAGALIALDQITKYLVAKDQVRITVIEGFFDISFSTNPGAGFSLWADKPWAQTLFKIVTPVALVAFMVFYVFAAKKGYKWLSVALISVISGTVGNYIDRLINGEVVDFLSFYFGSYNFPNFNVADICLTVGVIMMIFHFLFLDENAVFRKKRKAEIAGNAENTDKTEDSGDDEND